MASHSYCVCAQRSRDKNLSADLHKRTREKENNYGRMQLSGRVLSSQPGSFRRWLNSPIDRFQGRPNKVNKWVLKERQKRYTAVRFIASKCCAKDSLSYYSGPMASRVTRRSWHFAKCTESSNGIRSDWRMSTRTMSMYA